MYSELRVSRSTSLIGVSEVKLLLASLIGVSEVKLLLASVWLGCVASVGHTLLFAVGAEAAA